MNLLVLIGISITFLAITNAKDVQRSGEKFPPNFNNISTLPAAFDWIKTEAVSRIKNRGDCAHSDWAFATIGALEAQLYRKNHKHVELSTQELIDCSGTFGNHGCFGGNFRKAVYYIRRFGISSEKSYPYRGKKGKCMRNSEKNEIPNQTILVRQIVKNEDHMRHYVYTQGPILANINMAESFLNHSSGIYDDEECSKNSDQHPILIVGYGEEKSQKYWIVQNSRGEDWSEDGYIRIARDKNTCGIANEAYSITIQENFKMSRKIYSISRKLI